MWFPGAPVHEEWMAPLGPRQKVSPPSPFPDPRAVLRRGGDRAHRNPRDEAIGFAEDPVFGPPPPLFLTDTGGAQLNPPTHTPPHHCITRFGAASVSWTSPGPVPHHTIPYHTTPTTTGESCVHSFLCVRLRVSV